MAEVILVLVASYPVEGIRDDDILLLFHNSRLFISIAMNDEYGRQSLFLCYAFPIAKLHKNR